MTRRAPKSKTAKTDWHVQLTNGIVAELEKLQLNPKAWSKPWTGLHGIPHNGLTGRSYNGLNVWLLVFAGFGDPRFFTFGQAKQAVGYKKNPLWKGRKDTYKGIPKFIWAGEGDDPHHGVRKGEKGSKVFFYNFIRKYVDVNTGKPVRKPSPQDVASGKVRCIGQIPLLKVYTVFNATQIDGVPAMDTDIPDVDPGAKYLQAEALLGILGAKVQHVPGTDTACYRPGEDEITLPAPGQFENVEHYWATALHEVIHWTAHNSRLDRNLDSRFGSDAYAFEELVAELGSAFLCAHLGIEGELRHPEYLALWIKRLRNDKYAIFKAASLAQQAVDFILNGGAVDEEEDTSDVDPTPITPAAKSAA